MKLSMPTTTTPYAVRRASSRLSDYLVAVRPDVVRPLWATAAQPCGTPIFRAEVHLADDGHVIEKGEWTDRESALADAYVLLQKLETRLFAEAQEIIYQGNDHE
jgi:hypothetical protein